MLTHADTVERITHYNYLRSDEYKDLLKKQEKARKLVLKEAKRRVRAEKTAARNLARKNMTPRQKAADTRRKNAAKEKKLLEKQQAQQAIAAARASLSPEELAEIEQKVAGDNTEAEDLEDEDDEDAMDESI